MTALSHIINTLPQGVVLNVAIEDFIFTAYVVISEPDINLVADFVPPQQFEQDGDLHVTAVTGVSEARVQVEDLTFNMNLNDVAVFLCNDKATYEATLEELGQNQLEH